MQTLNRYLQNISHELNTYKESVNDSASQEPVLFTSSEFITLTSVEVRAKNSDINAQVALQIALPAILANLDHTVRSNFCLLLLPSNR
jgi:hypothetical protein